MKKEKEEIKLSDHFTYGRLIRFVFPSIIMMIFTSIYTVVDGVFVSNYGGSTAFAAVNLIMPFLMVFGAIGLMVGTGGTALVSMKLGEKKEKEANEIFSLLVYTVIGICIVVTIFGEIFMTPVAVLLGADADMLSYCVTYGRIIMGGTIGLILQMMFQSFMVAAEKPGFGLFVTILAGGTNIVLDFLLVGLLKWGIVGAAIATVTSMAAGGFIPLIYFLCPNKSLLRLAKPSKEFHYFWKACGNGFSEFMSNISGSVVNMVYNFELMKLVGKDGVSAYGVIMYVCFIFLAVFFGYGMGSAPIVGFHYGANNKDELKGLLKKGTVIVAVTGIAMTIFAELMAKPLSMIFVGYDENLLALTTRAFIIYSFSYLIAGLNVYASSFFTALNNGFVSAVISFARLFVFQIIAVLVLPLIWGVDGIWSAIVVAEILSLFVSVFFIMKNRKKYGYM